GGGEHVARVDDGIRVDVLVGRDIEEPGLGSDGNCDLAIAVLLDRADRLQQRNDGAPLDVMARRVSKDLAQCVPLMAVEVRWSRCRVHGIPSLRHGGPTSVHWRLPSRMPDGRWRPRPCPGEAGDRASAATFLTVDSGWREVC